MQGFSLPLGIFQVHVATPILAEAVDPLQRAIEAHRILLENSPRVNSLAELVNEEFIASVKRMELAGEAFNAALKTVEFPEHLPKMTRQLIFASLVAQAFAFRFEVINLELHDEHPPKGFWWVTGRITDSRGDEQKREGTSFSFPLDDEKQSEGALLSASADAFIHCVYAKVPYFPWDRWNN